MNPDVLSGAALVDYKRKQVLIRKAMAAGLQNTVDADLEIFGEPAFDESISYSSAFVNIFHYDPFGDLTELSNLYRISSVAHSISGNKFVTTLKLKKQEISFDLLKSQKTAAPPVTEGEASETAKEKATNADSKNKN
jgi:hypothetical protein